jgi:hypothetical protein
VFDWSIGVIPPRGSGANIANLFEAKKAEFCYHGEALFIIGIRG